MRQSSCSTQTPLKAQSLQRKLISTSGVLDPFQSASTACGCRCRSSARSSQKTDQYSIHITKPHSLCFDILFMNAVNRISVKGQPWGSLAYWWRSEPSSRCSTGTKVLLTVCLIAQSPGTPPTGHPSQTFPVHKTHVDWCGELPHALSEKRSHDPPTQRFKNMIGEYRVP